MTLGNPFGLIGLLSLPVILALHLLHRRQRRYVVSHLGLWNFLENQARGPLARRIPVTLILMLDLLTGALLSLAWAQPYINMVPIVGQPQNIVILLDISSSMRAKDGPGNTSRLAEAKSEVATLLTGASPQDVVTILGFGQHASLIGDSRQAGSMAGLAERIGAVAAGETGTDGALQEALALGQASLDTTLPATFHIVTDGDFPLDSDTLGALNKFAYPLRWHLVGGSANNQAVIELNAVPLAQNQLQVFTRIANFSDHDSARVAILQMDGRQVDRAVVDLPANSTVTHVWQVPNDASGKPASVVVSLEGKDASADALAQDDTVSIGFQPGGEIRAALVSDPSAPGTPDPIQQAVQAIPGVNLKVISPADYEAGTPAAQTPAARTPSANTPGDQPLFALTIFRNYLPKTWPAGVTLVVGSPSANTAGSMIPATGAGLVMQSEREIPASAIAQASISDPLLDDIDFSGVRWSRVWTLAGMPAGFTTMLQANGVPILLQGENRMDTAERSPAAASRSRVVVLLADLATGNFTKHPAFPILIANLVESARQAPLPAGIKTGEALPLPEPGSYQTIAITPPQQPTVELGSRWPSEWTNTLESGLYRFRFTRADGSMTEFYTGASAGDAVESDLRPRGWTETLAAGSSLSGTASVPEEQQINLRPWLLGAAILILLVEATLAWRR